MEKLKEEMVVIDVGNVFRHKANERKSVILLPVIVYTFEVVDHYKLHIKHLFYLLVSFITITYYYTLKVLSSYGSQRF